MSVKNNVECVSKFFIADGKSLILPTWPTRWAQKLNIADGA